MQIRIMSKNLAVAAIATLAIGAGHPDRDTAATSGKAAVCKALAEDLADTIAVDGTALVMAGETEVQNPIGGGRYRPITAMVPEHCVVTGKFEERTGADGNPYAFKIEMRLPTEWNGGMLFQGGGGLNGSVRPAMGQVTSSSSAPSALMRGFAVITTDSGHDAAITPGASFARDQLAVINYAYASIGKVAKVGKQIADAYYGEHPRHSYYWGCSNGGREAMIAAQRYPEEFDGIIAMNPAFEISLAAMLAHFSTQTYHSLGLPGESSALTLEDMQLVGEGVRKKCDALDGREDGLVFNRKACRFDPAVLQCKAGRDTACLPPAKVEALKRGFAGPKDANGNAVFGSWPWDPGVAGTGWIEWQAGRVIPETGQVFDYFPSLIRDALANYLAHPPMTQEELATLDHTKRPDSILDVAAITDARSTQFSTFAARGGKMILITGAADPIFSATRLEEWFEQLGRDTAATGGNAESFSRLFLNPGMNHCLGGPALDDMDLLGALDSWVRDDRAPDRLVTKGSFLPGQSRPLCPYPAYAHYAGEGDPALAQSYQCRMPAG